MLGNQIGFIYNDLSSIKDIHFVLMKRLALYMESYNLVNDNIAYIELSFRKKDKTLLSEFIKNPEARNPVKVVSDTLSTDSITNIPISVSEDSLGYPLHTQTDKGRITDIELTIDNNTTNFLKTILDKSSYTRSSHIDNIKEFDDKYKFYLLRDENNSPYVLGIKILDNHSIDKLRFSIGGILINRVKDVFRDNLIHRFYGENLFIIRDGIIIKSEQNIKLKPIDKPSRKFSRVEDNNIGVIHTETYTASDGTIKIHALGFKTLVNKQPVMFYIDKDMDSSKIVLKLIDELLRPKYSNIRFYFHLDTVETFFTNETNYLII